MNCYMYVVSSTCSVCWIMNLLLVWIYVVLPMFWCCALGWSGAQIGAVVSSTIAKASGGSQQAGAKGPGVAGEVVKTVATKGASAGGK